MTTVHGIANCDTVKKARKWLDANGVQYDFHDYKKTPPTEDMLRDWVAEVGHEPLVNRRGTTWRNLSEDERADLDDAKAVRLMADNPSLIRRPVVTSQGSELLVGFSTSEWEAHFG